MPAGRKPGESDATRIMGWAEKAGIKLENELEKLPSSDDSSYEAIKETHDTVIREIATSELVGMDEKWLTYTEELQGIDMVTEMVKAVINRNERKTAKELAEKVSKVRKAITFTGDDEDEDRPLGIMADVVTFGSTVRETINDLVKKVAETSVEKENDPIFTDEQRAVLVETLQNELDKISDG